MIEATLTSDDIHTHSVSHSLYISVFCQADSGNISARRKSFT